MSEQKSKIFMVIILGIVSVLLISAVSFTFPSRAFIPLDIDFNVGEKLVYDTTKTTVYVSEENSSQTYSIVDSTKEIIEVTDFNGESYTLNHTVLNLNQSIRTLYTEILSKNGTSTLHMNLGGDTVNGSGGSFEFVADALELVTKKPQTRVADSWRIPYDPSDEGVSGNLVITFYGFENLTVPAGTYYVFKVDIKSDNIIVHYSDSSTGSEGNAVFDFDIQIYFEYGSLRQIKYNSQGSITFDIPIESQSFLNRIPRASQMEMILTEDINH